MGGYSDAIKRAVAEAAMQFVPERPFVGKPRRRELPVGS
jgi:hypothetical protein